MGVLIHGLPQRYWKTATLVHAGNPAYTLGVLPWFWAICRHKDVLDCKHTQNTMGIAIQDIHVTLVDEPVTCLECLAHPVFRGGT